MADLPIFKVRGSTSKDFRKHIERIRSHIGTPYRDGVKILSDVDDTKLFPLRFEGDHGVLIINFRLRDIYTILWGKEPETEEEKEDVQMFVFKDADEHYRTKYPHIYQEGTILREPVLQQLQTAHISGIGSGYDSLSRDNGGDVRKVQLNRDALLGAVNFLSQTKTRQEVPNYPEYRKEMAHSFLVIVLMFPECLRFQELLTLVADKYTKTDGSKITTNDQMKMLNNWSKLSKMLEKLWHEPEKLFELTKTDIQQCKNVRLVMKNDIKDMDN